MTNWGLLNLFGIFCNLNPQKEIAHKAFLLSVAKTWIIPKPVAGRDEKAGPQEQPNEHLKLTHLSDLVAT
jgi:hypothetical protein